MHKQGFRLIKNFNYFGRIHGEHVKINECWTQP